MGGQIESRIDRFQHRPTDYWMRVAEQPCGVLTEKIDIGVPIQVPEPAVFAARHHQWKGPIEQHRAGIATGHYPRALRQMALAIWVALDVALLRLGQPCLQLALSLRTHPLSACGTAVGLTLRR